MQFDVALTNELLYAIHKNIDDNYWSVEKSWVDLRCEADVINDIRITGTICKT